MKIDTLLFGGAFDPPHIGHLNSAQLALQYTLFPELWFVPCYSDAFGQKTLSDPEHRIAMLELLIKDSKDARLQICTREIEMANKAGTYAVVKRLMYENPDRNFYYVIGSDQAGRIREWRNSRDLLKTIPFIVITRKDWEHPMDCSWCGKSPHAYIHHDNPVNFSSPQASSTIREDFRKFSPFFQENPHINLTKLVQDYIVANNLYK